MRNIIFLFFHGSIIDWIGENLLWSFDFPQLLDCPRVLTSDDY